MRNSIAYEKILQIKKSEADDSESRYSIVWQLWTHHLTITMEVMHFNEILVLNSNTGRRDNRGKADKVTFFGGNHFILFTTFIEEFYHNHFLIFYENTILELLPKKHITNKHHH